MAENINNLINPLLNNGALITLEETDPNLKIKGYRFSTYIQKQKILVKGEDSNKDKFRKALLVFFDLETGKVKGMLSTQTNLKVLGRHQALLRYTR